MYCEILQIVEEVTGVGSKEMLSSNKEEHVDARHILVCILGNRGFSDTKIAEFTNLTRPCICIIRNNFRHRRKRYFVNLNYQSVYAKIFSNEIVKNY